jgi:hypothetical protein
MPSITRLVLAVVVVLMLSGSTVRADLNAGLISHWRFDEGTGSVVNDSAGTNDGTIYGAAWTSGIIGGALDFDGMDDYVGVPDDNSMDFASGVDFSISVWVRSFSTKPESILQKFRSIENAGYAVSISTLGAYFKTHNYHDVGEITASHPGQYNDGTWHHFAGVRNQTTGKIYLYVDGLEAGSADEQERSLANSANLLLGIDYRMDRGFFTGTIDDVRIYDRALSGGEVEQLYAYGGGNLLVNSDFETAEITSGGWPSTYGDWSGDHCYILPRYGDVWPFQRTQLLQFSGTSAFGSGGDTESQVYQIVDVSAFVCDISAGKATATASAYFNRLAGDAETDREFAVDIRAFEGDPCSFPTLQDAGGMHLAEGIASILTDGDTATWEQCEVDLVLPVNTDYVVVGIHAIEDVFNDPCWPEFDGHCADATLLTITLEPNIPKPEGIYYVDGVDGSDLNDGESRETAFATIQKGIDAATDGNSVLVYPAVYDEALLINNKAIRLQGVATSAGIPIVQKAGDYAVSYYVTKGPDSLLKNFVLRGSELGIFIVGGAPTITNVTIVDNVFGIAAYADAQPDISNCIFWNNTDGDLFSDSVPIEARYSFFVDVNGPNEPPVLSGIVSHWEFDEGGGTTAYDSVGNNDGTVLGAGWTTGKVNGALSFDGQNDYVSVPDDVSLNITGDITIVAWVNIKQGSSYQGIVTKCAGSGSINNPFDFRTTNPEPFLTLVRGGLSGHERVYSDKHISLNQWHHVLVRVENKIPDFYVDGIITGKWADTIFTKTPTGNTKPVLIGRRDDGIFFNGLIDEVKIYKRALSAEEIGQLYQPLGVSPLFADAAGGDYHLRSDRGRHWPEYDVWVLDKVTNPCIDGGDPEVEPSNEPMPNGGRINMGAYGNTAYASMSEWPISEDNNRDGIVNMKDIANVASRWLEKLDWIE